MILFVSMTLLFAISFFLIVYFFSFVWEIVIKSKDTTNSEIARLTSELNEAKMELSKYKGYR